MTQDDDFYGVLQVGTDGYGGTVQIGGMMIENDGVGGSSIHWIDYEGNEQFFATKTDIDNAIGNVLTNEDF